MKILKTKMTKQELIDAYEKEIEFRDEIIKNNIKLKVLKWGHKVAPYMNYVDMDDKSFLLELNNFISSL